MNRCKKFLDALEKRGGSAALIHRPENMRWLTGYTGEGCVFVCREKTVVITDFRYIEQVQRQAPECEVRRTNYGTGMKVSENMLIDELCKACGVTELSVETDYLSYDAFTKKQSEIQGVTLTPVKGLCEELRIYKDAEESAMIQKACAMSCKAFENLLPKLRVGMTEKKVARMLEDELFEAGCDAIAFPSIVASGANGSLPHAIPGDKPICEGDLVTMDFGGKLNGYCADMTRTIGFGKISAELREIYQAVFTAQQMALDAIAPGVCCFDVDKVARDYLEARYPGAFGHGLGHSLGLLVHEEPRFSANCKEILKPGIAITVEPGVYIPGVGGVRIEDTVIITEDGFINAVTSPKQLIEL